MSVLIDIINRILESRHCLDSGFVSLDFQASHQLNNVYKLQPCFNPLTPTAAIWVPKHTLCQTGLSRRLQFLTSGHSDAQP